LGASSDGDMSADTATESSTASEESSSTADEESSSGLSGANKLFTNLGSGRDLGSMFSGGFGGGLGGSGLFGKRSFRRQAADEER